LGVEALRSFLLRNRRIALDTNVFIYHLEGNSRYVPLTDLLFSALERTGLDAITSTITMTELLVPAYKLGDEDKIDELYAILSRYPHLQWIPPDLEIAALAAELRALHRLKTPDALQAATAVHASATGFITNDSVFTRLMGFETLVLDRILA